MIRNGWIAVIEIETEKLIYAGRNAGQAAKHLKPGTWFSWGETRKIARQRALSEIAERRESL